MMSYQLQRVLNTLDGQEIELCHPLINQPVRGILHHDQDYSSKYTFVSDKCDLQLSFWRNRILALHVSANDDLPRLTIRAAEQEEADGE